jgi:hypothetical protein
MFALFLDLKKGDYLPWAFWPGHLGQGALLATWAALALSWLP